MLSVILLPMMVACGSDDKEDIVTSPDSFIIGTWHSFKGEVFSNGESTIVMIDKSGAASGAYMEFKFEKGNKVTGWWWAQDSYNLSHWTEGSGTYIIKSNVVTITDVNGDTVDLIYNSNDETLMLRSTPNVNGEYVTTNIYFKKPKIRR